MIRWTGYGGARLTRGGKSPGFGQPIVLPIVTGSMVSPRDTDTDRRGLAASWLERTFFGFVAAHTVGAWMQAITADFPAPALWHFVSVS